LNGPIGGRPKASQITKPHTVMTAIPKAMERLVMPCSPAASVRGLALWSRAIRVYRAEQLNVDIGRPIADGIHPLRRS
jgi:hypothetical protein